MTQNQNGYFAVSWTR